MALNPVLAIDSSGKTASVSIVDGTTLLFEETVDQGLTHSETLLPLIDKAFSTCGLAPKNIAAYAITAGPGSFTGLRIGLGVVKGLALPFQTPVVPVSTLEALATDVFYFQNQPGSVVLSALDARRNEVYWAAFQLGTQLERLIEDRADAVSLLPQLVALEGASILLVGDGAPLCYSFLSNLYPQKVQLLEGISLSRGAAMASIAKKPAPAKTVFPSYLRLSQAERNRLTT